MLLRDRLVSVISTSMQGRCADSCCWCLGEWTSERPSKQRNLGNLQSNYPIRFQPDIVAGTDIDLNKLYAKGRYDLSSAEVEQLGKQQKGGQLPFFLDAYDPATGEKIALTEAQKQKLILPVTKKGDGKHFVDLIVWTQLTQDSTGKKFYQVGSPTLCKGANYKPKNHVYSVDKFNPSDRLEDNLDSPDFLVSAEQVKLSWHMNLNFKLDYQNEAGLDQGHTQLVELQREMAAAVRAKVPNNAIYPSTGSTFAAAIDIAAKEGNTYPHLSMYYPNGELSRDELKRLITVVHASCERQVPQEVVFDSVAEMITMKDKKDDVAKEDKKWMSYLGLKRDLNPKSDALIEEEFSKFEQTFYKTPNDATRAAEIGLQNHTKKWKSEFARIFKNEKYDKSTFGSLWLWAEGKKAILEDTQLNSLAAGKGPKVKDQDLAWHFSCGYNVGGVQDDGHGGQLLQHKLAYVAIAEVQLRWFFDRLGGRAELLKQGKLTATDEAFAGGEMSRRRKLMEFAASGDENYYQQLKDLLATRYGLNLKAKLNNWSFMSKLGLDASYASTSREVCCIPMKGGNMRSSSAAAGKGYFLMTTGRETCSVM